MNNTDKTIVNTVLKEVTVPAGEDIKAVIEKFVTDNGWKQVIITGAVGSVIDMVFTTPIRNHLPLKVASVPISGAGEMLALTGEIMPKEMMDEDLKEVYPETDSPYFIHIHGSFATAGGHVFGGGLKAGKAFRSLRIFMTPIE